MSVAYEIADCPVCCGGTEEKIAGGEDLRKEVEDLWAFPLRRPRPGTPARYLTDRVAFSLRPPVGPGRCARSRGFRVHTGTLEALPSGPRYRAVAVWNCFDQLAASRAALAHDHLLGFPYRHGFTPESLGRLLTGEGFRSLAVVGGTLVPVADRWTRRWAAWEERAVKALLRGLGAVLPPPRFEVYARVAAAPGRGAD